MKGRSAERLFFYGSRGKNKEREIFVLPFVSFVPLCLRAMSFGDFTARSLSMMPLQKDFLCLYIVQC